MFPPRTSVYATHQCDVFEQASQRVKSRFSVSLTKRNHLVCQKGQPRGEENLQRLVKIHLIHAVALQVLDFWLQLSLFGVAESGIDCTKNHTVMTSREQPSAETAMSDNIVHVGDFSMCPWRCAQIEQRQCVRPSSNTIEHRSPPATPSCRVLPWIWHVRAKSRTMLSRWTNDIGWSLDAVRQLCSWSWSSNAFVCA